MANALLANRRALFQPIVHRCAHVSLPVQQQPLRDKAWLRNRKAYALAANGRLTVPNVVSTRQRDAVSLPDTSATDMVSTTFCWPGTAVDAQSVSVVGSWNDWQAPLELKRSGLSKDFTATVKLKPGLCQFKFMVDGVWRTSQREPCVRDKEGQFNNQRLITGSAEFRWRREYGGKRVFVAGDFNGWGELLPLDRTRDGDFVLPCNILPGKYNYLFWVDDGWKVSPDAQSITTRNKQTFNRLCVRVPPAFHVFYATGWNQVQLHYRLVHSGKPIQQEFKTLILHKAPSRARPVGGWWYGTVIPVPGSTPQDDNFATDTQDEDFFAAAPLHKLKMEFYLSDAETGMEDRPRGGGLYLCNGLGGYKLARGQLLPFPRAMHPPVMAVSDIDGTMYEEGNDYAHAGTAAFMHYWENNAALAHSVLVYNTGRSLGQFTGLWKAQADRLALPDVVITAVGTKIHVLDDGGDRATASGEQWREDMNWARRLDKGWDLGKVRRVAEDVLRRHGDAVGWLDRGDEHPHRISLQVRRDVIDDVLHRFKDGFKREQVSVKTIVSGQGEWRFVDNVSMQAGKLEALEYVRQMYGIDSEQCVSFGDSGNDILMLEGEHPAVVVGNAQPELLMWFSGQPQFDGKDGKPRVIYTDAPFAWGILEGLARHGLY